MTYSAAALIFFAVMLISASMVFLIRKFVHISLLQKHHDVAFTIFLQVGVIYGVLLAFVVSMVWGQFNVAAEEIQQEASCLLNLARLSQSFSSPLPETINTNIKRYMNAVVDFEWKTMARGKEDLYARELFNRLQQNYLQYKPQTLTEVAIFNESLKQLTSAGQYRRIRLFQAGLNVPGLIWVVLITFAVVIISLSYFFGMENIWSQAILTAALASLIASILLLILLLDNPYGDDLTISKKAFTDGLKQFSINSGY